MKGAMNPLFWILGIVVGGFLWASLLATYFQFGYGWLGGIFVITGLFFFGHALGVVAKGIKIPKWLSILLGFVFFVILGIGISIAGIFGMLTATPANLQGDTTQNPLIAPQQSQVTGDTTTSCLASVTADNQGKSATLTYNAYDKANSAPLSNNVNANISIYKVSSMDDTSADNFLTTATDTTGGSLTTITAGSVVSIFGNGGVDYYVMPKTNICVNGQQGTVNLDAYAIAAESNIQSALFDSSGNALSAGNGGTDKTTAMGASAKDQFSWEIKVNAANKAYYLGAVGFATGTNISDAYPIGSAFKEVATPQHMKDIAIAANSTAEATQTKTYTVFELTTPKLLTEYEKYRLDFKVEASANDPVGAPGTAGASEVYGLAKDATYIINPSSGVVELRIDDGTTSEADIGLAETETSPCGLQTGFCLEVT